MSFNVVCIKWGTKYGAEYVNNLHSMVERHLTVPHRFVCLTDDVSDINPKVETKELLDSNLEGWWNKLSIFKKEVYDLKGPTVFLDLDVVIIDNIDFLFTERPDERFIGTKDFIFPNTEYNSSVLRFNIGECTEIFNRFIEELSPESNGFYKDRRGREFIGDQQWITQSLYPNGKHVHHAYSDGKIVSYKKHVMHTGSPSPKQAIIVFHGKPNPHELEDVWIKDNWR